MCYWNIKTVGQKLKITLLRYRISITNFSYYVFAVLLLKLQETKIFLLNSDTVWNTNTLTNPDIDVRNKIVIYQYFIDNDHNMKMIYIDIILAIKLNFVFLYLYRSVWRALSTYLHWKITQNRIKPKKQK